MGLEKGSGKGVLGDLWAWRMGWGWDEIIHSLWGSGAPSFAQGQEVEGTQVKKLLRFDVAVWTR